MNSLPADSAEETIADETALEEAVTCDTILGGRLKLLQPFRGHRAGTDAVLLAASAPSGSRLMIDVGAGVGTAGLAIAMRDAPARTILLERDPLLASLASQNIVGNRLARVAVAQADALSLFARRSAGVVNGSADLVVTNPPFFEPDASRHSPDARKRAAHVIEGGLEAWIKACLAMLRPSGTFCLVHRAEMLPKILRSLGETAGEIRVRPVQPKADAPATRLLVQATKGSRAPLLLLPALVLHDDGGGFTPRAAALHDGQALSLA